MVIYVTGDIHGILARFRDNLTHFLYEIEKSIEFKHWYFGHYHGQTEFNDGKHTLLYLDTKKIV